MSIILCDFNVCMHILPHVTGAVIIPGACSGILVGGYLMKKLSLDVPGIAKLLVVMDTVPTLAILSLLFLGCHTVDLVGITSAYSR